VQVKYIVRLWKTLMNQCASEVYNSLFFGNYILYSHNGINVILEPWLGFLVVCLSIGLIAWWIRP
jgi:hypothetical protein